MNTTHASRGLATFALAALPLAVQAQGTSTSDADGVVAEPLNPLTVTATRAPRTADETLASVTVIDEAALRRQDPTDITDLLRGQPGVDVSSNGGFGKTSSVYLRGTSSKSTLLMIDGIRLRSATAGGPAWQFLDPRQFERIEIVRGPRGSLYGADAVGGVVQLFTPQGEGAPTPRLSLGGGSFDTRRASASLSGSEGGTRYHVAASRLESDGYEILEGEGDKGYDNTTGLVRLAHGFDNGAEVGVLALRARGSTEFVGGETDFVQQVAGLYGELPVTEAWTSRLTLSEARDKTETAAYDSLFDTTTRTLRWENTVWFGPHELVAGAEYQEDDIAGSDTGVGTYAEESRDNVAVFAQALMDFSPVSVQAGLRHDDNEAFGEELTGHLALGFALDDHHTLRASYGTAYRAPTFNELYYPDLGYFAGNPDLEAETSATVELGVRGQYARFFWDLAAYETRVDDFIASTGSQNENIDEARIRGVELASGIDVDAWTLQAALTLTDTEDRETGHRLPRRASQSLRLDLDRELGDWSLGGSFIAQDDRFDDAANEEPLSGFGQVDLRADWRFAPLWSARLSVDNVFDREYATTEYFDGRDYLNAGRTAFLSVNFGP
ncbi:Vitamin B12 transporter BtuB precursor [Halomonas sp. THAF5a]|uniref:TonB-dependent receptor domain-containing protein n=1 Tax=Halomonas sp. THAF5a TaxID=2587844 RepID=UPI0012691D76|nr:TonB-dependent receptor [Halomonas sp. THAF5a]QFU02367.1 Vitamin B12 transporter BtuB precursor [Halomonas sp. THAF5a]